MRSKQIMDSVERGESFTVTRGGREIADLVPIARRRQFISRTEFARGSVSAPSVDLAAFRRDLDAAMDTRLDDPYDQ
jgi:prevent-host-death family protein